MVMKGLPLAYQKDMQEDKEGAIDAFAALTLSIDAMTGMVRDMEPDVARMRQAAGEGYATATDLADWLTRALKLPFREAHHVTGRIVAKAADAGVPLDKLPLEIMQAIEPRITKAVFGVLSVEKSVESRTVYGGTAPKNVRAQAKRWLKRLKGKADCGAGVNGLARCFSTKCRRGGAICYAVTRLRGDRSLAFHRLNVLLRWPCCGRALASPLAGAMARSNCRPDRRLSPAPRASARPRPAFAGRRSAARADAQETAQKNGFDAHGNPVAPPGQKKPFLLDPLLQ